jgi:hypothetical protein
MVRKFDPQRAARTVSRRSLLRWLGGGAVLALGGATLASCLGGGAAGPGDGGGLDGGGGGGDAAAGEFPFAPGGLDRSIFEGWGERTVDRQDLGEILAAWQLRVDGMVERPHTYSFAELVELPRADMNVDFHCVEGWSIYDVPWNGLHLSTLFDAAGVDAAASHVTFHTIDGKYNESLPLEVALEPRTRLAYGIGGYTLPLKHGFPLRIVIPRLYAYKSAKYIERIELTDHPIEGFWVAAGYPYDAEVPQDRLRPGKY